MVRHHPSVRPLWLLGILAGLMLGPGPRAVAQPADPAAIEEARELQAMRRFLALLERNPRRGTALDRVYGFHVERGSLDDLLKSYRDRLDKNPHDGTAWLILGLLEFQRGQDAAAVAALRHAEADRPADPLPPYYLGQALVLVGQPDQAADAFERALQRKPLRTDLLEIFQALGRVYQRTQKTDKALQVWQRLEALFPNDLRVQEQIAAALAEEDQPALALPRFETLAKRVADPFRQVQLAMQAAELKVRLGKSEEALRDFEAMLGKLRPESWLHREVRRKIEEVFLRNDDQAGLVTYYQRWTAKEPEDVEALVRLGRTLAAMGRVAEAQTWYEKAIQRAPGRRDLRLALIAQLAQDQKYAEAAAQYEALDKAEPNNPDTLRDWGALVLRDTSRPPAERKSAAAAIWRKLRAARPNDAVTTAQVADLLRQAELVDEALALYRQACAQAPNNPQYREYLGEYLHQLKRPAEAQAEWARIAEGPNRNARNLARLAEVLAGFGYLKEAIAPLKEAVDLEQEDFDLRLKLAELSHKLERYDDAAAQLLAASKLAEKAEEKSAVLEAQVKNDQAAGRLAHRIEAMRKALESGQGATAEAWGILARYLEADGKLPEAVRAADRAIQTDPRSVPAWTLAARVRESAGNLGDAADAMRRLAELDRKNRAEYLTGIAKLESRLGRIEAALKAGRDLLAAAPGNPEHYEFFAQLCFQLGRSDEGLDVLRRAARINANDPKITLTLAETLAGLYRTDEAIEMYWRAFDKAEDLDAKLGTVSRLTELYLQRNQFDRLLTRLQHQERDARPGAGEPQQRDVAICMAQAYAASGDLGSARAELERLLAANTRDTKLLQQLSKLSEEEGDLETAARYQKQLEDLAPSDEGAQRLAQLYARAGELEEAQAVWSKIAAGKSQAHRIFQALDNLLANHKYAAALETTEALVRKDPKDWEALYRQGVALASCDKPAEAEQRFRALLELTVADDEKSAVIKAMSRDPRLKAAGTPASSPSRNATIPLEDRLGAIFQVRMACKLDNREVYYAPGSRPSIWSPPDFGQARMAALGWLLSLAQKESPARANEFLTRVRQSAEQTPSDLRALWDWFYLCGLRQDNLGVLAAGRALSRAAPTDPLALWAYLYAIGGRSLGAGQRYYISQFRGPQKDTTPPLEKDELEHVLACYRSLRTRRPELAQAQILQNVSDELKRAKRVEDEERFYREAVAGSTQLAQIVGAFAMASQRGDVEGLIQLRDRYERLQPWRSSWSFSTGSFYFHGPGTAFSQGMGACAERKAYGDILRLLDFNLAAVRRRMERQTPGAARARRARTASSGRPTALPYTIWVGKTARNIQIAFPLPNEYLDDVAIQVLRTAYEIFKRDDLVSDLVAHLRRQAEAAQTPADAIYPRLALSDVLWWNDDKDEAIAEFTKVAEASRAESDLRLDLAELLEQQGQRADALALAESVQPQDNTTMKRREELALRLAVASGDLERARQAAERLFGLRLDTDTQVRLAGQMHQLGLHELAEAVLSRARRRAGNKATALVGMMLQYQRQGQLDVAVQVAMQILRSTTATRQTNPNVYYAEDPDASRTAAIGVLARSGRLPQLIDRANEQLKKTPNAIQIHQALADYYKAAGQRDRARAELDRMIALRPDDTNLRLQVAQQLVQEGQAAAAVDQYKVILEKDPALVSRRFFEVQRIFQQARKTDELMNLLETMDLRRLGNWSYVFNVISNLLQDDTLRNRAMNLVRKAWEAFPDDRSNLLRYLGRGDLWQMPEMYDYAVESLVPTKAAFAPAIQWNTLSQILSYSPDGRMNSVLSQLLDLAASQGRLDELAARVDAARGELPGWTAGAVVRALIDCRLGRYDRAQSLVRQLLDSSQDQGIPSNVLWVLGAELEGHAPTRDLAIAAYEATLKGDGDDPYSRLQFDYGPARRLVSLYAREDRREDARRVLVRFARTAEVSSNVIYPPGYIEQMKMQGLGSAAGQLLELGYAADAITLYSEALALASEVSPGGAQYLGNPDGLARQYRDSLTKALEQLKPEDMAAAVSRMIEEDEAAPPQTKGPASTKAGAGAPTGRKAPKRDQFLDLMVLVHPRELDKARVRSLLADAISAPAPSAAAGVTKGREQLAASLEAVGRKRPDDLSVAIAEALVALSSGHAGRIGPALDRLSRLVEKTPMDPLPDGTRPNARQRAEAARQVPLWLVARACWNQKEPAKLAGLADRLADRALEAARRQPENQTRLAMLRERGELALARGDRKAAEAAWTRMLEIVLETDRPKPRPAKPAPPAAVPPRPVAPRPRVTSMAPALDPSFPPLGQGGSRGVGARPQVAIRRVSYQPPPAPTAARRAPSQAVVPRSPRSTAPRSGLPILTLDRFEQAMQIARLAAEQDMPELSARAVREALRGGPPVVPAPNPNQSRVIIRSTRGGIDEGPPDEVSPKVVAYVVELERIWQKHRVPAELVYRALREAVLPPGRPTEVFLYAPPLNTTALRRPQSVGAKLADWAVRAGQVDDLRRTLATRRGQAIAELPAAILATQLAIAAGDSAGARQALRAIAARTKNDSSRATSELACHAAIPALDRPQAEVAAAALEVLDACAKGLESANSPQGEPLSTLLLMLARRQLRQGDAAGGRKRLEDYLEAMEKTASRYGGDYPLYLRKQQLQRVASEYARAGLWSDALAALARYFDAPTYSGGDPPVDDALVRVLHRLDAMPARERYNTLHDWTMPAKDRRAVRVLTSLAAQDTAPEVFARATAGSSSRPGPAPAVAGRGEDRSDVVSTATALIEAARQAGTLDQLADEARAAAEQKIENAEVLHLLVELARGQGRAVAPRIEARLAELIKENAAHAAAIPSQPVQGIATRVARSAPIKFPWTDHLLARAAVQAGEPAGSLGLRLIRALVDRAERINDWPLLSRLRADLAEATARRAGAPAVLAQVGLASWHAADTRPGHYLLTSEPPTYWLAHQGHVAHPSGSTTDLLLFDYPLTGSYEFSVDNYAGPSTRSVVEHHGMGILPSTAQEVGGGVSFTMTGHTEYLTIPWRLSRPHGWNRLTIQATPGKVRYLVNGHLLHEDDDPSPTSPWIGLLTSPQRHSVWRNLSLRGQPVIPREVRLSQGDRLEGWVSSFYLETRPPRWGAASNDQYGNALSGRPAGSVPGGTRASIRARTRTKTPVNLDDYDWAAQDGVIHGRRLLSGTSPRIYRGYDPEGSGTEADQSRLYYLRPLKDGDSITYEFLYEPGQVMVHPSVDRLAFLLEPEGVKVHWITMGGGDRSGLPADNAVEEPGNRRGPTPLPLKAGAWNQLKLALNGDRLTLDLNGQAIYQRAMEPTLGRQFGLFHYKDQTASQVRNIVLRGRWPEALTPQQLAALLEPDPAAPHSEADRRARHAVIGEPIFALEAGAVVEPLLLAEPSDRYQLLADWVLPSPDHPVFRLEGEYTPSFLAGVVEPVAPAPGTPRDQAPPAGVRLQTGGVILTPAAELVEAARELGKLDELARRVDQSQVPEDDNRAVNQRGRLALLALIQIARGDDAAAARSIETIRPMLEKRPLDQPEWMRWPELTLAARALDRPTLRRPALALLETMTDQAGKTAPNELWTQHVKSLRARAELLVEQDKGEPKSARPFGTDPETPLWARVTPTRAETRGDGWPIAHWSARDDQLTHSPGHEQDWLYLAIPLRGDFQLDCELTSAPGREIRVAYGGLAIGPKADLKHLERTPIGRPATDLTMNPPLEKLGEWYPFRLVVKAGRVTALINGRKVHEAPLPPDGDPWLAFLCPALQTGGARKVAITGDPQVPETLKLSALPELSGWLAGEYHETTTGENPDWDKRGEEIVGRLLEEIPGAQQESVLRYHRPMVEDGRIAYEFYYEPGKVMVHPALDRLAFLLEPDGVKIHWLTDGASERTGLAPENTRDEPENRRGASSLPLKPKSWNRLVLSMAGDRVTLQLNDQVIYERTIERTNQRGFGLFHYADATQVRVRHVTYEGKWPRSLPASLRPR